MLVEELAPTDKLTKDVRKAAKLMTRDHARYLVDRYYQVQRDRIRAENQARIAAEGEEPNELLEWNAKQVRTLEANIKSTLNAYSLAQVPGIWAQSIFGCGPVISAGMLAHIDIEKAPTVGPYSDLGERSEKALERRLEGSVLETGRELREVPREGRVRIRSRIREAEDAGDRAERVGPVSGAGTEGPV